MGEQSFPEVEFQILLSLNPMAPRPRPRPSPHDVNQSPLEEAIVRGHWEIWNILKDHIEMTVELKLEQLYNMMVHQKNCGREDPHKEFRELLSSLPVESITPISKGDPPMTCTLLQARYTFLSNSYLNKT